MNRKIKISVISFCASFLELAGALIAVSAIFIFMNHFSDGGKNGELGLMWLVNIVIGTILFLSRKAIVKSKYLAKLKNDNID